MLCHAQNELARMLASWPAAEDRLIHLYELDPTHVAAQAATVAYRGAPRASAQESRSPAPFNLLSDEAPAMLELDPLHLLAYPNPR